MADMMYNVAKVRLNSGLTQWGGATPSTVKALLLASTAAGAQVASLTTVAALLAVSGVTEVSSSSHPSYARQTLGGLSTTQDDPNTRGDLKANNTVWLGANFATIYAMVTFDEGGGTDATRYLMTYHDTSFPIVTNGSDLTIAWPGGNVLTAN